MSQLSPRGPAEGGESYVSASLVSSILILSRICAPFMYYLLVIVVMVQCYMRISGWMNVVHMNMDECGGK